MQGVGGTYQNPETRMNTIYLIEYSPGKVMRGRFATDADSVESLVRMHYRNVFGASGVGVAIDMDGLTATVSKLSYKKVCRILRFTLDKAAQ
jgi:hypothetical protein